MVVAKILHPFYRGAFPTTSGEIAAEILLTARVKGLRPRCTYLLVVFASA
jgi:hypothetical protein